MRKPINGRVSFKHFATTSIPWLLFTALLFIGIRLLLPSNSVGPEPIRSTTREPLIGEQVSLRESSDIEKRVASLWNKMAGLQRPSARDAHLPKCTEEMILELEDQIGGRLPADYRAFLKIFNGAVWHSGNLYPSVDSIQEVTWSGVHNDNLSDFGEAHRIDFPNSDPNGTREIVSNLWHPALITIIEDDGAGYVLRIDTGEIFYWDHDGWYFKYVCNSFEELLRKSVAESIANKEAGWWMGQQ